MPLSLATWNINSVRLRLPLVLSFLAEYRPDILCLQEIKCPEEFFPYQAFHDAGYPHVMISGQKGYHGVATISRCRSSWSTAGTSAPRVTAGICRPASRPAA